MENAIWNWKDADVHSLIRLRTEKNGLFTGKRGTAKRNWDEIAVKLAAGASGHQCKKKWKNLVTKYKTIILPSTGEGLEEQEHDAESWPFFNDMDKFMSNRHTMKPILTLQSASCSMKPQQPLRRVDCESTSTAISPPHPSPTLIDHHQSYNHPSLSTIPVRPLTSYPSTPPPRPSSASASYNHLSLSAPSTSSTPTPPPRPSSASASYNHLSLSAPSTSSTPTPPPRPSSASAIHHHHLPPLCTSDGSPGSQSWSSSYSGEGSVSEDSVSIAAMRNPRKRRRTISQSNSNDDLISELLAQIKAEMEENRRQQEEARKNEQSMLEILKSILNKK